LMQEKSTSCASSGKSSKASTLCPRLSL
jgi:hypothetical protein